MRSGKLICTVLNILNIYFICEKNDIHGKTSDTSRNFPDAALGFFKTKAATRKLVGPYKPGSVKQRSKKNAWRTLCKSRLTRFLRKDCKLHALHLLIRRSKIVHLFNVQCFRKHA